MNTKRQENVEYTPEDCLGLIEEIVDILKDDSFSPNGNIKINSKTLIEKLELLENLLNKCSDQVFINILSKLERLFRNLPYNKQNQTSINNIWAIIARVTIKKIKVEKQIGRNESIKDIVESIFPV